MRRGMARVSTRDDLDILPWVYAEIDRTTGVADDDYVMRLEAIALEIELRAGLHYDAPARRVVRL